MIGHCEQEYKKVLFKFGYIYNIEKVKRKIVYYIRWEKNQHTPHYLPLEGVYSVCDIKSLIRGAYVHVPVSK